MSFKKFDGSTWQPITPKKLKGIPYTGTLPAVLTGTKAGYLHRYKIYGNTEQTGTPTPDNPIVPQECGERTENLWDFSASTKGLLQSNGSLDSNQAYSTSNYIPVTAGQSYTFRALSGYASARYVRVAWYDSDKQFVDFLTVTKTAPVGSAYTNSYTAPNNASYVRVCGYSYRDSEFMFVKGSTAPTSYIPYGYKLPLTSADQDVDIYIGDDTISAEEYVDSGTGKIYRMVGGTLTPVDPPVPFPQIPTSAGSITISWAGEGLAPSKFDSIQEWVDIPTYTRVNGEWVADN